MAEKVSLRVSGQTTEWDIHPSDFLRDVVEEDVRQHTIDMAYSVWDGLMKRSPVYTGRFRASWYMGLRFDEFYAEGGSPESPLSEPARPKIRSRAKYPRIYITNGAPYFDRIEYGSWSNQAPAGVVRVTLESLSL